jgi:hypothetical protein
MMAGAHRHIPTQRTKIFCSKKFIKNSDRQVSKQHDNRRAVKPPAASCVQRTKTFWRKKNFLRRQDMGLGSILVLNFQNNMAIEELVLRAFILFLLSFLIISTNDLFIHG